MLVMKLMINITTGGRNKVECESDNLHTLVLMIMADHQTFSSQFWGLSLLYIVDGKVGVGKEMSNKSQFSS